MPEDSVRAKPAVTTIIALRNRSGTRLDNCLRSLRWQDVDAADVEIVLSDFGSDPEHRRSIAELAERYDARVIYTETDEVWNRSRALNIGIRAARGRYVFCTDADMIFEPDFVSALINAQRSAGGQAFVVCRCRDLPEEVPEQPWVRDDYPELLRQAPLRDKLGTGACQMARRSFFEELRGYDEGFKFWGMEDNDMRFRAGRAGLIETWVHAETSMLHQWHPSDRGRRPLRKFLNDARFHLTKYRRVKNPRTWGGAP